jgi:hypothetical protein
MKARMPDILYIMGTGRSGTTILEILLASNPRIVGVGEFKHVFQHAFLENRTCSCGKPALDCEFWSGLLAMTGWGLVDCKEMGRVVASLESHMRFALLWTGLVGKKDKKIYRRANEVLFRAIAGLSRSDVVVDSSKYETRAMALAKLFPDRVRVLCMTRSASGLIAAFQKKNEEEQVYAKSLLWIGGYYAYVLFCMWSVKMKLKGRCLSVSFEELKRDPEAVLDRIEAWSGYSLTVSREKLAKRNQFSIGHIVSGNRIRTKGKVSFESTSEERAPQSLAARVFAGLLEAYRRLLGF